MEIRDLYKAATSVYMTYRWLKHLGFRNDAADTLRKYRRLMCIHSAALKAKDAGLLAPQPVAELLPRGFIRQGG